MAVVGESLLRRQFLEDQAKVAHLLHGGKTSESGVTAYVTINLELMSAVGAAQPFPASANHNGWVNFWRSFRV
jgi:hypothetical protein